jgi:hypothetical protein
MIRSILWIVILFFISTMPSIGQIADPLAIHTDELGARLRFLSSDLFQGRYPGTIGESLTTSYLISELQSFRVKPGANNSWLQPVSIVIHEAIPGAHPHAQISGRVSRTLEHGHEIKLFNYTNRKEVKAGGELVFVGYGISAPMYSWDDFKGLDLRGKVAVAILGEPAIPDDSVLFNGSHVSRFSWFRDKIIEMDRRGAIGVLWIQPEGSVSQATIVGSSRLAEDAKPGQLLFTGLLKDSTFAGLLPRGPGSLTDLISSANKHTFRYLPLGIRLDIELQTNPTVLLSNNVVGVVPGTDANLAKEHIVVCAHWDACGIKSPVNGDSICNGTLDDGSGVTAVLALARVFALNPQPRSITFLFCTAEEMYFLGSSAFVRLGPLARSSIIANINIDDGGELFGATHDLSPLGMELSSLGKTVSDVASRKGLSVLPDPYPENGNFFRSDNFPFAKMGIPALNMGLGLDDIDHPPGWTKSKADEYLERHYHQPSDDYATVVLDLRGALQLAEFTRDLIIQVAQAKERPQWLSGSEFSRSDVTIAPGK